MSSDYSLSLITLLKGILYNHQKAAWDNLLQYEAEVKKYFSAVGLDVYLDKSEGYAYLQQIEFEEESELPRLAEKRQLNFFTSLLCVVLRKYLLEQDAEGGSVRAIITEQGIIHRTKSFLPSASDEAKQQDRIISTINRVVDMGFLRKLDDEGNNYEIHRIIKGFVNAGVIDDMLHRLEKHAAEKNITE
jgi:Domain of unknown function (DUF4194)